MIDAAVIDAFAAAAKSPEEDDLPLAALLLGRLEHRTLDPTPYLVRLRQLGERVANRIHRLGPLATTYAQADVLNTLLFEDEGLHGNVTRYDDPRNSFLNDVLDRRVGIPISLSVIYVTVAGHAGLRVEGVSFPGHFLVRFRPRREAGESRGLIVDPFHQGAILAEPDLRQLARKHLGEEAGFDPALLATANKAQILTRMLQNLKRLYVNMRSFPQARDVVALLVAMDPDNVAELRDRGLLSLHRQDFQAAVRDLEAYFRAVSRPPSESDEEERQDYDQLWEHLKALRRRAAGLN